MLAVGPRLVAVDSNAILLPLTLILGLVDAAFPVCVIAPNRLLTIVIWGVSIRNRKTSDALFESEEPATRSVAKDSNTTKFPSPLIFWLNEEPDAVIVVKADHRLTSVVVDDEKE